MKNQRESFRLPAIAPKNDASSASSSSASPSPGNLASSRRSRMPPRSKSGCWTCRNRKVKCDEARPSCGVGSKLPEIEDGDTLLRNYKQCTRLGHECDYNPRLSFRNDTSRVVERMQDISTTGSIVWDPEASEASPVQSRSMEDLLPPFAALTTDEDRERKAEHQNPGTYHVIANPESFSSLPEYRDDGAPSAGSQGASVTSKYVIGDESAPYWASTENSEDPNTIFLKSFTNSPNRSASSSPFTTIQTPISMASANLRKFESPSITSPREALSTGRDNPLWQHYRAAISPRIFHTNPGGNEDLFEAHARTYPPLFHAMMALAALDQGEGIGNAESLEHYQAVIPALKASVRTARESFSDGALFTHFILLLYEVAAVGRGDPNMLGFQKDQLLRIIIHRRQELNVDPHDFIFWTICSIDTYALLSGNGAGNIVYSLQRQHLLPTADRCLTYIPPDHSLAIYPEENEYFPSILKLNQEVMLLAFKVGKLARDLRQQHQVQKVSGPEVRMQREAQIRSLRHEVETLGSTWRTQYQDWLSRALPSRVFASVTHSHTLIRALTIYTATSMYPKQLHDLTPDMEAKIKTCVTEIIQVARALTSQQRHDQQFIIFPLFMAAVASRDAQEKDLCLEMLSMMEELSYGRTVASVREFIEKVYEKQQDAIEVLGNGSSVDWVEGMQLSGQRLIIYGL